MKLLALPLALLASAPSPKVPVPAIKLTGYFACTQSMLVPGKDVLSCYAPSQRECQNGQLVLAYEKRLSPAGSEPRYQIVDTVHVSVYTGMDYLTIASCTQTVGKPKQYFVLCKHDTLGGKYLRHILRVWGVSPQGKLVEVPAKTIKCFNDSFGA